MAAASLIKTAAVWLISQVLAHSPLLVSAGPEKQGILVDRTVPPPPIKPEESSESPQFIAINTARPLSPAARLDDGAAGRDAAIGTCDARQKNASQRLASRAESRALVPSRLPFGAGVPLASFESPEC